MGAYDYNDRDVAANASSQGTPQSYASDGPAQGYARNPMADAGSRNNDMTGFQPIASQRPTPPASDTPFNAQLGPAAVPNSTPSQPGVITRAANAVNSGSWLGPVADWMSQGAQMEPGAFNNEQPAPLTVNPSVTSGNGRTGGPGGDRDAGAGYRDTQSYTVNAGGNVKPYMSNPTDPDANLPTAPVQPYGQIVQNANQAMANNYNDRLAAEDARRPNSQEVASAKREAEVARFRATDGADMVLGSPRLYAAQRAAIVQNAANATGNAQRLDNLARGASQVTPPNLVQGAVAQTEADQRARGSAFDQQKGSVAVAGGKQGLAKGAQELKGGSYELMRQGYLTDLAKRASTGDKEATNTLALWQKAQKGEGGPLTEQESAKLYSDQQRALMASPILSSNPEALHSFPTYAQFKAGLSGQATPPPADWMARAKAANPGADEDALTKLYAQKAR